MATLIKPWNDGSGDTFTVIYDRDFGKVEFSSMPNKGIPVRESYVTFTNPTDSEDSFAVKVIQVSVDSTKNNCVCVKENPTKQDMDVMTENGLNIRSIVILDKDGSSCSIKFEEIGDE